MIVLRAAIVMGVASLIRWLTTPDGDTNFLLGWASGCAAMAWMEQYLRKRREQKPTPNTGATP